MQVGLKKTEPAQLEGLPGSHTVYGMHKVVWELTELESLPHGGLVENVVRLGMKTVEVSVQESIGMNSW